MTITIAGTGTGKINELTVPTAAGSVLGSGTNYPLNIDASATAESLKIDSSGRIFAPNRVMFYARKASGSGDVTGVFTAQFDTKIFDIGNGFNTSTGLYTAPVAGVYYFCLSYFCDNGASGRIDYEKNGVIVQRCGREAALSGFDCRSSSLIIDLAVNDTIEGAVTSGNMHINSACNFFSGFLLG